MTMELNAEQINKGLDCCTRGRKSKDDYPCGDCPCNEYNLVGGTSERQINGTCQGWLMKDALALIKQLTEENESLRGAVKQYEEERKYHFEMSRKLNADTVREMQNRLAQYIGTYTDKSYVYVSAMFKLIDRIAKEMTDGYGT